MRSLSTPSTLRAIGFDDTPFPREWRGRVRLLGAVCAGTRFEGLVSGWVQRDGWNATGEIVRLLHQGKFLPQLHLVLLDGLGFAGFNLVNLPLLASTLGRPCLAVMRRPPQLDAVQRALGRCTFPERRRALLAAAGPIHQLGGFTFQIQGASAEEGALALARLTDRGKVPEALRLAHLIGGALVTGESGRRA